MRVRFPGFQLGAAQRYRGVRAPVPPRVSPAPLSRARGRDGQRGKENNSRSTSAGGERRVHGESNTSERKLKTPSLSLLSALNPKAAQLLLSVVPLFQ